IHFNKRGWVKWGYGYWEIDHVIQRNKGGTAGADNCLPACTRCNRLRWHRTGVAIRELLFYGLIAIHQIQKGSELGDELERLGKKRPPVDCHRRAGSRSAVPLLVANDGQLSQPCSAETLAVEG